MKIIAALQKHVQLFVFLIVAYLAKYGCNVFLAQHFSPKDYGDVNIILRMIALALPVVMLGADATAVRFLPALLKDKVGNASEISSYLYWLMRIVIFSSIVIFACCFFLGTLIYFTGHSSVVGSHHDVFMAAIVLPLFMLTAVFSKLLQSHGRLGLAVFSNKIMMFVLLIVLLAISFYIFEEKNFYATFLMLCASLLCVLTLQCFVLYPHLKKSLLNKKSKMRVNPQWMKTAVSYMAGNVAFVALCSIDLLALEVLGKNEAEVGYFSAILVISSVLYLVSATSALIVNSEASICYEAGDIKGIQALLSNSFIFNAILALIFLIGALIFGSHLLSSFGLDYVNYYSVLVIVLIGTYFICISQNASTILMYTGSQLEVAKINAIGLVVAIVLDVVLISLYGMNGAVFSLLFIGLSLNYIRSFRAKKLLKIKPFILI